MNNSRRILFGCNDEIDLSKEIVIPQNISNGIYKCRVIYAQRIFSIEFMPYQKKKITNLQIVTNNLICYEHKYEDRKEIDKLFNQRLLPKADEPLAQFSPSLISSKREDDILIVKNNLITDTSFANVVLSDGVVYLTPSFPLLKGTKRAKLLEEGLIREEEIFLKDLKKFKCVYLINAMLDLDESNKIPIENIV